MKLNGARILVVDDHLDLAENLREILEEEGASVAHATSVRQAESMAALGFDIALVDIRLPDGTGLNLLPRLRALNATAQFSEDQASATSRREPSCEVLLITGNASMDDAIEAVKRGAYDYIVKPFDPDQLVASVVRAFRQLLLARETALLHVALADSELSLRTLVDTVQALLIELDQNGRILRANRAAIGLVGRTSSDLVGVSLFDALTPSEDRDPLRGLFSAIVGGRQPSTQEKSRDYRLLCQCSGGVRESWIAWHFAPLRLESGESRVYACGIDVTDLRDLQRRTRLNEKLAAVGTLAAGLAHEIRNPLNAMSLQMQLLARRIGKSNEDLKVAEPIEAIHCEISRLSHLVEDFLRFARPSDIRPKPVDIVAMANQVVGFEHVAAQRAGVELSFEASCEEIVINGDSEKLRQVLVNLISNGVDAAGPGGRVRIVAERTTGGARVSVIDTGPGIAEEFLPRIFEPFFSTKEHGTGLGMAICHSLVSLHGGDIRISCDNETAVRIELPLHPPGTGPASFE
jgi:PAS domain S-box-containing protein